MGYARAGFEVVGADVKPQPNYPFEFHLGDALEVLAAAAWADQYYRDGRVVVCFGMQYEGSFHAIHASPPCQASTTMSNRWRGSGGLADERVNLIAETRELLEQTGLPYVIENVPGARADLRNPVVLNGGIFGLSVDRPRLFETNWPLLVPARVPVRDPIGVYGKAHDGRLLFRRQDGSEQRAAASLGEASDAMGIDWMEWRELAEAIPPAYCELVGTQLLSHIRSTPVLASAGKEGR